MPKTASIPNCDVAILSRMIRPERNDLPVTAARAILKLDFEQEDHDRMQVLAQKARDGTLTKAERIEITEYERVGHVLGLLHSKARKSLKKPSS